MKQLLIFSAEWCQQCKPYKKTLATTNLPVDQVRAYDVDETPSLAAEYGVRSVPTTILQIDGVVQARKSGALTKEQLLDLCS
jgi:thioredoxin 1